jgi:hypothetical protein
MIGPEDTTRPDDLMKPDLFSEILLVGSGLILFVPLLLILVSALTQSVALR